MVMNQLLDEQNQNLINALFGACLEAQRIYLPPETVPKFIASRNGLFMKVEGNETEELGKRLIELPESTYDTTHRGSAVP